MSALGSQVDRYELLGELATGGMATVYLGRQRGPFGFTRTVAIKSMHPQFAKDPDFRAMFLDEATLTARIRHPNVVPTLDIVAAASNVLIVMEYIEGVALSTLLRRSVTLGVKVTPAVASAIACDLLHGLHAAHTLTDDHGQPLHVVHRDVSPQNVHVGADGLARVLDFGVAKAASRRHVTQGGEVKGKLAYMSGEQVTGEEVDHRTDVYAAGVVLWETLTAKRLVTGHHEGELIRKVLDGRFEPPSAHGAACSPALDAIVMKALAATKEARFSTADEMAQAIAAASPPAPRSVVAALVRELAATELESRSARLRAPPAEAVAPEAKVIAELLTDHATVTRAATVSSKTVPPPAATTTAPRRSAVPFVIGGGVLVSAAIVGAFVIGTRITRPAAPSPPAVAALPPATSSVAAPPLPALSVSSAPAVASSAPVATSAPAPAKPIKKPVLPKKPDCRVPYVVDAHGDRHYRPECVE